jgi:protein TonB
MKLDIFKGQWIDIVFENKNKIYGAYQLRKDNPKTTMKSLAMGAALFAFLVSIPMLARLVPDKQNENKVLDTKITTVKLPPPPPKEEVIPENLPPPPPPPPREDVVKFVKPVVAKAEEVFEEPPKIEDIKDKNLGAEDIKGDPDAALTIEPPASTPPAEVIDDNTIYNTAGIAVQPDFPGGIAKFYQYVARNFRFEEAGVSGRIIVTFVVEKDGSLTDIKVVRDIGHGAGDEAIRVLKRSPKWTPGVQNGKNVRVLYSLPISIQAPR